MSQGDSKRRGPSRDGDGELSMKKEPTDMCKEGFDLLREAVKDKYPEKNITRFGLLDFITIIEKKVNDPRLHNS